MRYFLLTLLVAFIVFGFLYDTDFLNKLICKMFGHKSTENIYSGAEYMDIRPGAIDSIGREHATLWGRCPRCGVRHRVGQVHRPHAWMDGTLLVWDKAKNR